MGPPSEWLPTVLVCFVTVLMGPDLAGRLSSARGRSDLSMGPWRVVAGLRLGGTQLYGVSMIPARSRLGAVAVSLLGGALLVAGCAAGNPAGTGKPSPSPKPTASASTGSGRYLPSKWVNSKGVFVAPVDSGASASLKAQWEIAYGVLPPPHGFVSGLGQVPVTNAAGLPTAKAAALGQQFLVEQGYEDYFLTEGSGQGLAAVGGAGLMSDYTTVSADLQAGGHIQVTGCALPTSLEVVAIPTALNPPQGDTYGLLATFVGPSKGQCVLQLSTKSAASSTVAKYAPAPTLYAGSSTKIGLLGTIWKPVGGWSCPGYRDGESLASVCVAS